MKKQPQVTKLHVGCQTAGCSTAAFVAPLNLHICVGFGSAAVYRNGKLVWYEKPMYATEEAEAADDPTVWDIEKMARKSKRADWRIQRDGPLHGETFQRQGKNKWVCIESNEGFA